MEFSRGVSVGLRVEGRGTVLKILGMHCATCSLTVQKALLSVRGVKWAEASLASNEARLVVAPEVLDYGELLRAVRRAGYDVYRESAYVVVDFRPEEAEAVERRAGGWGVSTRGRIRRLAYSMSSITLWRSPQMWL